jgi:hypothetical protein
VSLDMQCIAARLDKMCMLTEGSKCSPFTTIDAIVTTWTGNHEDVIDTSEPNPCVNFG